MRKFAATAKMLPREASHVAPCLEFEVKAVKLKRRRRCTEVTVSRRRVVEDVGVAATGCDHQQSKAAGKPEACGFSHKKAMAKTPTSLVESTHLALRSRSTSAAALASGAWIQTLSLEQNKTFQQQTRPNSLRLSSLAPVPLPHKPKQLKNVSQSSMGYQ